jgi:hypothetical protein
VPAVVVQAGIIPDLADGLEKKQAGKHGPYRLHRSAAVWNTYANTQQKSVKMVGMWCTICQNCKLLTLKIDHIFG